MFPLKGQLLFNNLDGSVPEIDMGSFEFVAKVDQDYLVIGGHIDDVTQGKIIRGEYIDFSKLIPRDKIISEEDNRLKLVVKNGRTFWAPVSESVSIKSFSHWEQAFRIFSTIM